MPWYSWRHFTPPLLVLILANLVPLYGVWLLGWGVFELILLYWMENVVIGVFNVVKMASLQGASPLDTAVKFFIIPFFTFHYGMFTAVHGIFVLSMFGDEAVNKNVVSPLDVFTNAQIFSIEAMPIALSLLAASHLAAYYYDFIRNGAYLRSTTKELMHAPYKRVLVLHITIIFGGFLVMALHEPLWALGVMIAIKLLGDIIANRNEKRKNHDQSSNGPDADGSRQGG